MKVILSSKIINMAIVVLLLANTVTMVIFWWREKEPPQNVNNRPKREVVAFLVEALKMTPEQRIQLESLREKHRRTVPNLRATIDEQKEQFFSLIKADTVTNAVMDSLWMGVAMAEKEFEKGVLLHFREIRAVCDPEQKKAFDQLVFEALRMMKPGGGKPGGRPEDDRPPRPE